jgi:hypothetical protein
MNQSMKASLAEACTQAFIGIPVGWSVCFAIAMLDLSPGETAGLITGTMFLVSVVRGYWVRRRFERALRREIESAE